jgi:hypothetical protein
MGKFLTFLLLAVFLVVAFVHRAELIQAGVDLKDSLFPVKNASISAVTCPNSSDSVCPVVLPVNVSMAVNQT